MLFTQRFNEILSICGMSQAKLAAIVGISSQCIRDYKNGKSFPSAPTLYSLSLALSVSSDYLLGLSDI